MDGTSSASGIVGVGAALVTAAVFAPLGLSDHGGIAGAGWIVAVSGFALAFSAMVVVPALAVLGARASDASRDTFLKLRDGL